MHDAQPHVTAGSQQHVWEHQRRQPLETHGSFFHVPLWEEELRSDQSAVVDWREMFGGFGVSEKSWRSLRVQEMRLVVHRLLHHFIGCPLYLAVSVVSDTFFFFLFIAARSRNFLFSPTWSCRSNLASPVHLPDPRSNPHSSRTSRFDPTLNPLFTYHSFVARRLFPVCLQLFDVRAPLVATSRYLVHFKGLLVCLLLSSFCPEPHSTIAQHLRPVTGSSVVTLCA